MEEIDMNKQFKILSAIIVLLCFTLLIPTLASAAKLTNSAAFLKVVLAVIQ